MGKETFLCYLKFEFRSEASSPLKAFHSRSFPSPFAPLVTTRPVNKHYIEIKIIKKWSKKVEAEDYTNKQTIWVHTSTVKQTTIVGRIEKIFTSHPLLYICTNVSKHRKLSPLYATSIYPNLSYRFCTSSNKITLLVRDKHKNLKRTSYST